MTWIESTHVYTHADHSGPNVIFVREHDTGTTGPNYAPGVWHTIDLKPLGVTSDATFAELAGHIIISDADPQTNDLQLAFRKVGSTISASNYQIQGISVSSGDGHRGMQSVTVPLDDGRFEFYWRGLTAGAYDAGPSSFLANMHLEKWGRNLASTSSTPPAPGPTPTTISVPPEGLTVEFVQES